MPFPSKAANADRKPARRLQTRNSRMPMLEETGSIGLDPTGVFRIDDSRKFIGALLKFGQNGEARMKPKLSLGPTFFRCVVSKFGLC